MGHDPAALSLVPPPLIYEIRTLTVELHNVIRKCGYIKNTISSAASSTTRPRFERKTREGGAKKDFRFELMRKVEQHSALIPDSTDSYSSLRT